MCTKLAVLYGFISLFLLGGAQEIEEAPARASTASAEPGAGVERGAVPDGLTACEWASIRDAYEAGRHAAYAVEDGYRARNPAQQWVTHFDGRGFTTTPDAGGWKWGLELRSYGFPGTERAIEGRAPVRTEGSRVAYAWDATLEEWCVNDRRGLEHGYTVREPPPRAASEDGPLTITLAVRGGLQPEVMEDGLGARFVDEGGAAVLTYAGLAVFDAGGRSLPAHVIRAADGLQLVMDERGAQYPLTIDPSAQQAYFKASNTNAGDQFGWSVSVSGDTVVVGANGEDSNDTGVNGNQGDDTATDSGAAYIFVRGGATWTQQAYLKASNTGAGDGFGTSVAISGDTVVVGGPNEDSNATGVNDNDNDLASDAGAAYVFVRSGTTWTQQAYLKASNTDAFDYFGYSVSVSGETVVVGAHVEDSNATGADGDGQDDDSAELAGAAYVFVRSGTGWTQQAYLKASNTDAGDVFGASVSISGDTIIVGAEHEASNGTGVNGVAQADDSAADAGAAYVFVRNGTTWTQQAYLKASNTDPGDFFGHPVSVSGDTVVVGARREDSSDTGVNGDENDDNATESGAAYVFARSGTTWTQQAYLKPSNTDAGDEFGWSVSVSGDTLVVGARFEDSNATGVNGGEDDDSEADSGAAYSFVRGGTTWTQQAYLKASNTDPGDLFGYSVSVSGGTVVVGAHGEASNVTGVNGNQANNDAGGSGVAYAYTPATIWTGATDSDWTDSTNWSGASPDSTLDAIIPDATTTPNDPSISINGQTCSTLWIQPGGTLEISAGMDSLRVFGGATVLGPITETTPGQLVFAADGALTGDSTIGLTFSPAVRADADLELAGGPLSITGDFLGNADVAVAALATFDIGGSVTIVGDLAIDGSLSVGDGLDVGSTLSSSSSSELVITGMGACKVGQLCVHGEVMSACSLTVEPSTVASTVFEATNGWPASVSINALGTVNLLTADLVLGGDLVLVEGTFAVGVDGTIEVNNLAGTSGIVVEDGATFDITGFQTRLVAPAPLTIEMGGKLNIGAGGELLLEGTTVTIEDGGTLCLVGVPSDRASISSYLGNRYTLALNSGSTLAAKGFGFSGMSSGGIVIGSGVTLAAAPFDLRGGVFDDPASGGVLLDIQRSLATQLRYLRFDNSFAAAGVTSVRTSLTSSVLTLVNWSGDLAPDATTAEMFDDDPGESSPPERIVFAPPESSDVQDFAASWRPGYVKTTWQTLAEIDSESFLVQRSPEPPGLFTTVGETPSVGASIYELRDYAYTAFAASRYRLYERLTHGELRLIDEVMLPASGIVLRSGGNTPAPPGLTPVPVVVGPGGTYPDVRTALFALARSGQSTPVTLELARGTHAPFVLGRGTAFDLCLVARTGAVIDASHAPVRIEELSAERSLELVNLAVDARRGSSPALEIENAQGVVLIQDVRLRGNASAPGARLVNSTAVILQGGAIEGMLVLASRSRATASSTSVPSLELTGRSTLETRGVSPAAFVEPGSTWLVHAGAPRLGVSGSTATLEAEGSGLAWLGLAPGLGFKPFSRPLLEGLLLLEPSAYSGVGAMRQLVAGRASWPLGPLPQLQPVYLQGFVFDPTSGRICLSNVVRVEDRP